MGRVAGKVALITGAASGLGRADALALAREGAQVIVSDINEAAGRSLATEIGGEFVHHDVRSEADWQEVIAVALKRFGKLNVLVNNAGNVLMGTVEDASLEQYRLINAIHAEGTFLGCRYGIEAMKESGGGSIINMASLTALRGFPLVFAYSAAKGAIRAMTSNVAVHCKQQGYGIRCNAVFPGVIDTPLAVSVVGNTPGAGQPNDVANAILFLASDESKHMNGAEIVLDNGASMIAAS